MYQQQAERILEKIRRLRLELMPVISEEHLSGIEKGLNVQFPESYKVF